MASRRQFLKLAGLSAMSLPTLAACATIPPPQPTSQSTVAPTTSGATTPEPTVIPQVAGTITLKWWPGWPGPFMEKIVAAFRDDHPGITIDAGLFYPEEEKLLSALAGGTAPDVAGNLPYQNYIVRGLVQSLDDLIGASKQISVTDGDIRQSSWEAFEWKGKHYGIPSIDTAGRESLGINLDLAEKAELDTTKLPTTWEEVYAWHDKLTTFDKAGNLDVVGIDPLASRPRNVSGADPWLWPELWGFKYFNVAELKYDIDRPETVEFLETILKFYEKADVQQMAGLSKAMESQSFGAFGAGKQAMLISYPSGPDGAYVANPKGRYAWTWVPVPERRKGTKIQTAAGHATMVLRDTRLPQQAFDLAVYLTLPIASDILLTDVGWLGPRKSWQKTVKLDRYPQEVRDGILFFTNSLDEATEVWTTAKDPEDEFLSTQWSQVTDQVANKTITPKDGATFLQTKMQAQIERQSGRYVNK